MLSSKLLLLVSLSLAALALADSVDFTQCFATVAKKEAVKPVTDLQCSYCAEGRSVWPCDTSDLCECVKTAPLPPPQPWQLKSDEVSSSLLNIFQKTSVKYNLTLGDKAVCGIFGNIATLTNNTFDYKYQNVARGAKYGLFQIDGIKVAYFDYIKFFNLSDSVDSQVRFVSSIINKYFNWGKIPTVPENPLGEKYGKDLYASLINPEFSEEQQAENFASIFVRQDDENIKEAQAAARHCYYVLSNSKPTVPTTTLKPSLDFSKCYATTAIKGNPENATDLQCAYCAEGRSTWPCDSTKLCVCHTEGPAQMAYQWQNDRLRVVNSLIKILQKSPKKYNVLLNNESICGILANVAAGTNFSFDYKEQNVALGARYGLFQIDGILYPYQQFIAYFGLEDSIDSQVDYVAAILDKNFTWSETQTIWTNPLGDQWAAKLYAALSNTKFTEVEKAKSFHENFGRSLNLRDAELEGSAKHCIFLLTHSNLTIKDITTVQPDVDPLKTLPNQNGAANGLLSYANVLAFVSAIIANVLSALLM